jgi:hypothetical protein
MEWKVKRLGCRRRKNNWKEKLWTEKHVCETEIKLIN